VYILTGNLNQGLQCLNKGYSVYEDFYGQSAQFIVPLMLSGTSSELALKMSHIGVPIKKSLLEDHADSDEKDQNRKLATNLFEKITGVIKSLADAEGIKATDWSVESLMSNLPSESGSKTLRPNYDVIRRRNSETRVEEFKSSNFGSLRAFCSNSFSAGHSGAIDIQFLDPKRIPTSQDGINIYLILKSATEEEKLSTKRIIPTISMSPDRSDVISAQVLFIQAGEYDVEVDGLVCFSVNAIPGEFSPHKSPLVCPLDLSGKLL
jgi:hypothetical protein